MHQRTVTPLAGEGGTEVDVSDDTVGGGFKGNGISELLGVSGGWVDHVGSEGIGGWEDAVAKPCDMTSPMTWSSFVKRVLRPRC